MELGFQGLILTMQYPSLRTCEISQTNLGPNGSAVLTIIGHKQIDTQTDKKSIYI